MNGILNESTVFEEYDFNEPDILEVDNLLDDVIKDCRNKQFHTIEYKLDYDFKFTNNSNDEKVNFTITHRSMEFKTEFYGWNKKIKNARENGFIFNQINKLTIKIYGNLSNINIHYYLKLQILILHRQLFKILSQNREYIQTHCNGRKSPFHFACREWYLYNKPQF